MSFAEILKIIENEINEKNEEMKYKAFILTSLGQITHLSYREFVDSIDSKMQSTAQDEVNTDEIEKSVEEMLNRYKWQEV
ncbi:hypothetical protein [Ruminococcus sp.]|uniref:hypothetical protein n=1 Tax=Ruminococcus sp. TaxID=41978 RepID=UPI003FD7CE40